MKEYEMEWIENVRESAGKLAPYIDKNSIEKLLLIYTLEENGKRDIKNDIDYLISTFSDELLLSKKTVLECPSANEAHGEIKIGRVMQGEKVLWDFGISPEELNQHMLITARSGAGKSTLIIQTIRQLLANQIPFTIIDHKVDYRHLIRHYPQLVVINWKDLRINPLEPPKGVQFQEWKQQFLNIFGHVEGIWQGSTQYLLEAIDESYEEKKGLVSLEDVYRKIVESNEKTRKLQEYASVVEIRLYGLLSKLGDTINNERTLLDMEKLLQLPVVLELHGIGKNEADIITLWLFYWIYAYRRAKGIRGKLLHVLIIDEAKRIFTASEQYSQTTAEYSSILQADLICDEIRDYGEGIIASDQEPTKLSNSIKANTFTKITGFLGNGKDISDMSYAMDLNEKTREVITQLERGEWLVKLAGRYVKPFIIKTDDFPLIKDVSDTEISERLKSGFGKYLIKDHPKKSEPKLTEAFPQISNEAWSLLLNINSHPFKGLTSRYGTLKLSGKKASFVKNELIQKNLVIEISKPLGGFRPVKFLKLSDLALNNLQKMGYDTTLWQHIGHTGFDHQLYVLLIASAFRAANYETFIEKNILGGRRRVDVLTDINGQKTAIEVELGPNIDFQTKLLALQEVDELIFVTEQKISNDFLQPYNFPEGKVKAFNIQDYLRFLRSNYIKDTNEKTSKIENKQKLTDNIEKKVDRGK